MMQIFTSIRIKFWKTQPGFSLLELLISVALLGLVMSLLYGGFFQISNSSLQVKSTLETRQELRLLMKMVLDDLQNVQYLKRFAESGQSTIPRRESGLI
ncbi:MAG: type II secretion system protein, partial [SAR324 cluster bacterium]|nr:type II secretion system protein [SAR324 cluster bacterium]